MLRDETDIVLNNVLIALENALDHHRQAKTIAEDHDIAALFYELSGHCAEASEKLETHIRQLNYLPEDPDPERQTLSEIATRIKTVVSDSSSTPLLKKANDLEAEVEHHINNALQIRSLAATSKKLLEHLKHQVRTDLQTIESAASAFND